eukprot:g2621.t1
MRIIPCGVVIIYYSNSNKTNDFKVTRSVRVGNVGICAHFFHLASHGPSGLEIIVQKEKKVYAALLARHKTRFLHPKHKKIKCVLVSLIRSKQILSQHRQDAEVSFNLFVIAHRRKCRRRRVFQTGANGRFVCMGFALAGFIFIPVNGEIDVEVCGKRKELAKSRYVFPDGEQYEGELKHGLPNGHGVKPWPTRRRFEGEFVYGKMHGRGVETWEGLWSYEGEMADDRYHGQGVWTSWDGDRYEGGFEDGWKSGQGVYTWPKGERYEAYG